MPTTTTVARDAVDRLRELGLTRELLTRALLRADAEAKLTTSLEPPNAEGTIRYIRTVGFLRQELAPAGWVEDNARNFCRTIHPGGKFAIVVSSGDQYTGLDIAGLKPSTKYPKGETTARAVETNAHPAFDLGSEFEPTAERSIDVTRVWFLLQYVNEDENVIRAELSLPRVIEGGYINDWTERILLDPIDRDEVPAMQEDPEEGQDDYTVDVALR